MNRFQLNAQTEEAKLLDLWIMGVHSLGWIVSVARRTAVVGVVVGAVVTKHHGKCEEDAARQGGNANQDHLVSGFQRFRRPWPVARRGVVSPTRELALCSSGFRCPASIGSNWIDPLRSSIALFVNFAGFIVVHNGLP
jgi:hypothetical protein